MTTGDWLARGVATAIAIGLLVMSAGFYLFPDYGGVARAFYLLVLLPVVVTALARPRALAMPALQATLFLPLPIYLATTSLWGGGGDYWDLCKPALFLAALAAGSGLALRYHPRLVDWLPRAIVIAALPGALLGLATYLPDALQTGKWPRMGGISLRGDINVTAALHGLNCLFCAWGLQSWQRPWRPWLYVGLLLSLLCALLSQSKVALFLGLLALAWSLWQALRRHERLHLPLILAVIGAGLLFTYFAVFGRVPFLYRSEAYSVRLDLWSQALGQAASQPWLGHGLGAELPLTRFDRPYHSHVHNIALGTLRYGGIVGLALLLWQVGGTLWLAWRRHLWRGSSGPLLLWWLAGLGFLLTNGGQPLVKPHHSWFFYWIPLALLLAVAGRPQKPSTSR